MIKKLLKNIFSLIVLFCIILTIVEILKLDVLPSKYLTLVLLGLLLYNLKNKFLMVLGIILFLISIAGNIFGYYYLNKTNKYIDKSFAVETYKVTTHYYLVTGSSNTISDYKELDSNTSILYNKNSNAIETAMKELGNYKYSEIGYGNYTFQNISKNNGYFLIPSEEFDFLIGSSNELDESMFKILYEFDVVEEFEVNNDVLDSFNVYITGYDYTGKGRDYNLLATVNSKTHKVVLTSIPRDYYINIPAYNAKDSLKALGVVSSEIPKEALEELFNTKIDYTVNLYTESLVEIVDTLGGIEFCSDYDFITTHDTTIGSYADKGDKVHVSKGCNTYNGHEILSIARERMHINGGERARQENCRKILISIVHKLASTSTLTNYSDILNSFEGLYTTNINKHMTKQLIKEFINNPNFEIIEQNVDGRDGIARNHWDTGTIYTLDPDMNTVNEASKKINEVLKEK